MRTIFKKVNSFVKDHKIWSTVIVIAIVVVGVYSYRNATSTNAETRYVLGTVERGTLLTTVNGTGQVSSTNELEIKPKVSGEITYVGVKAGQEVKAGAVIVRIDSENARKSLRDAEQNLASAEISYQKNLQSAQTDLSTSKNSVSKAYDDGFSAVSDVYISLPSIISDINDILYSNSHSPYLLNQNLGAMGGALQEYKYEAGRKFDKVKIDYERSLADFKRISRNSTNVAMESTIDSTYTMVKELSTAINDLNTLLSSIKSMSQNVPAQLTTDQTAINSYLSKTNGFVSSLSTAKNNIDNANRLFEQKTATLNGSDTLDIQSAKLTLDQRRAAVADARDTLADYTITAPFDGVIGKVEATLRGTASSGGSLVTLITEENIATISLNEIDVSKVKTGQKANISFDAITDLTLTGTVSEVDQIGTVSQGVVSYNVKITFDIQDERVKPGMSMSATIITDSKSDVLVVPSSAVKTNNNTSYVEVLDSVDESTNTQVGVTSDIEPRKVQVKTGSSSDTHVEIVEGLTEGDKIITRTITSSSNSSSQRTSNNSIFGGSNVRTGTGGAVRVTR